MRNQYFIRYKKLGFIVLSFLLVMVTTLAFLVDLNRNISTKEPWLFFAMEQHTWIMVVLMLISVAVGFLWSALLYKEIENKTIASKSMLNLAMLFFGEVEKRIFNFLVENNGKTTQAEISRLEGMDKVKAYRFVQKMQEKGIIRVSSHGKIRNVILDDSILNAIQN